MKLFTRKKPVPPKPKAVDAVLAVGAAILEFKKDTEAAQAAQAAACAKFIAAVDRAARGLNNAK